MPASPCAAAQWEADPGARAFYETAATAAAALGVRVDVFAACGGPCGLDALEPLAAGSGGALLLYPHVEQAALPQARGNAPARSRHGSIPRAAFFGFLLGVHNCESVAHLRDGTLMRRAAGRLPAAGRRRGAGRAAARARVAGAARSARVWAARRR